MNTRETVFSILIGAGIAAAPILAAGPAFADEGGISFWLPGLNGSFASVPGDPGFSFSSVYYHASVDAGGSKQFAVGGEVRAGLEGHADLAIFGPTYTFDEPVAGGLVSLSAFTIGGRNAGSVEAELTGPKGRTISGSSSEDGVGFGDIIPQATLKWNKGVNNYQVYVTGDIPVGQYDKDRLANVGLGHGAIDGGVGYTYLNPATGLEFSVTTGVTYNFENTHTDYQNGIDGHVDWAVSHFISPTAHVGITGYYLQQLTGDSGDGATLGDFKSRVLGVGPELGFFFPAGHMKGYLGLKGFYEFEAKNRPEGWNTWVSLAFTPAPPAHK